MFLKRFVCIALAATVALAVSCKKDNNAAQDEKTPTLEGLSIVPGELELNANQKFQLYVSFEPEDIKGLEVEWSSDNQNAVKVSETGLLTASWIDGEAVVTARCGDKEAYCKVSVIVPVTQFGFVSGIQSKSMAVGEEFEWSVVYMPTYATDHEVTFENSDRSVVDFTQDAADPCQFKLKAKKLGASTITAKCGGKTAELFINVDEVKAGSVQVLPSSITIKCGEIKELEAFVGPVNATNKDVSWYSLMPDVVTVHKGTNNYATVKAVREGNGTIAAYCGDAYAYCNVTVSGLPEGAVDLGLSVYWAECNLGASSAFDAGNYYAWGELVPKSTYDWTNYKFYLGGTDSYGSHIRFSRYNDDDGKKALDSNDYADDAARQTLGGQWSIPTIKQFNELVENCEAVFESEGVRFYSKVTGHIGQSIYFPLVGYKDGDQLVNKLTAWHDPMGLPYAVYNIGYCWLSELGTDTSKAIKCRFWLNPNQDPFDWGIWLNGNTQYFEPFPYVSLLNDDRYIGLPIRPVW